MSSTTRFKAIAAIDSERGLGKDGDLPWHLPGDLKHFATTTKSTRDPQRQNAVIMGRITCQSIPEKYWPLAGRINIVITRDASFTREGAIVCSDLESALAAASEAESIFVVGGGQIYGLAIEHPGCEELILTRIAHSYGCDAFFPAFEERFALANEIGRGEHEATRYTIESWMPR